MKIIEPSFEILDQKPGLEGIYEQIELAGRTCYKSERKEGTTAKDFVDRMIASKHHAMLEHSTVYLKVPVYNANCVDFPHGELDCVIHSHYSKISYEPAQELEELIDWTGREISTECMYITTNYRVLVENDALCLLEYLCEPTEFHEKRVTVRFTTDIGVSREFNRHRVNSIAEQSTRYCNFSKDKFDNEISVCLPPELEEYYISKTMLCNALVNYWGDPLQGLCTMISNEQTNEFTEVDYWLFANLACEWSYMNLIRLGWKPQQARRVLPLDLCTELVHTAFVSDWQKFFDLRAKGTTGAPHPDAKALAEPLMHEFEKRKLI